MEDPIYNQMNQAMSGGLCLEHSEMSSWSYRSIVSLNDLIFSTMMDNLQVSDGLAFDFLEQKINSIHRFQKAVRDRQRTGKCGS